MEASYSVKQYDSANWLEKAILHFVPYETHESVDGFVIYKVIFHRLYIYASGRFIGRTTSFDPAVDKSHERN